MRLRRRRCRRPSTPTRRDGSEHFPDTIFTNLGVRVPGVIPPRFGFTASDGDPSPGSLALGVTFTDFNQYVDAIINPFRL